MPLSGRMIFLPWGTLPHPNTAVGILFMPIDTHDPAQVVGLEVADAVKQAFGLYVDLGGNPIGSGTIAGVVFPFSVKLKLADAGLYPLSARDTGACEALDRLLNSNWKKARRKHRNGRRSCLCQKPALCWTR